MHTTIPEMTAWLLKFPAFAWLDVALKPCDRSALSFGDIKMEECKRLPQTEAHLTFTTVGRVVLINEPCDWLHDVIFTAPWNHRLWQTKPNKTFDTKLTFRAYVLKICDQSYSIFNRFHFVFPLHPVKMLGTGRWNAMQTQHYKDQELIKAC